MSTLNVKKLSQQVPEIFFREWPNNKWFSITIEDLLNPNEVVYKNTIYFCYAGKFRSENPFTKNLNKYFAFWFTKQSFEREIIRHVEFREIAESSKVNACFDFCRMSERMIRMRNFKLT